MTMILMAYFLGMLILAAGVVAGKYVGQVRRQFVMNNFRREVGLQTRPVNLKFNR